MAENNKKIFDGGRLANTNINWPSIDEWRQRGRKNWVNGWVNEWVNEPPNAIHNPVRRGVNPFYKNKEPNKAAFARCDGKFIYHACPKCNTMTSAPKIHGTEGKCRNCEKPFRVEIIDTIRYKINWRTYVWRKL